MYPTLRRAFAVELPDHGGKRSFDAEWLSPSAARLLSGSASQAIDTKTTTRKRCTSSPLVRDSGGCRV